MSNKDIKRHRMMGLFIDAAIDIMNKEGVEHITIRKVASVTGYNSATLYSYFKNLDHLIMYASISRLKDYVKDLHQYIARANNSQEEYLAIWECFCHHAFLLPDLYYRIFFGAMRDFTSDIIREYYLIFPSELRGASRHLVSMLITGDIFQRNQSILRKCADEKLIPQDKVDEINNITIYYFRGVLAEFFENNIIWNADELAFKTIHHIETIFNLYSE